MKKLLLILSLAAAAYGQPAGSTVRVAGYCAVTLNFTTASQTATIDNRFSGCNSFTISYAPQGFSALSLLVQSAPDAGGTPGTWVTYSGTVATGSNPNTSTSGATTTFTGYVPWIRAVLSSKTGTGTIYGTLYGQLNAGTFTGSVTAITSLTSVASAQADGSTNTPQVLADGSSNAMTNPAYGFVYNGTTWDRMRGTTLGTYVQGAQGTGVSATTNPLMIGVSSLLGRPKYLNTAGDDYSLQVMISGTSAAISLADAQSNTQKYMAEANNGSLYLAEVGFPYVYNGTTWDRKRGNTSGAFAQGPVASAASNAGNPLKIGGPFNTTQPTVTNGQVVDSQFSARGSLLVTPGVEGFPVTGTITSTPGVTASTSATALTSYLAASASTNATSVKGSAGNVYAIRATNTTATVYYVRMYNLASAPTCSSATGFIESIAVPASTSGAGIVLTQPFGQAYTTGIGYCITGGAGATDNTAAATGVLLTILYF